MYAPHERAPLVARVAHALEKAPLFQPRDELAHEGLRAAEMLRHLADRHRPAQREVLEHRRHLRREALALSALPCMSSAADELAELFPAVYLRLHAVPLGRSIVNPDGFSRARAR